MHYRCHYDSLFHTCRMPWKVTQSILELYRENLAPILLAKCRELSLHHLSVKNIFVMTVDKILKFYLFHISKSAR